MESSETAYEDTESQQVDASDSQQSNACESAADDTGDDTSSLSEALLKGAPIIVYACVFYARLRIYQWLGLPHGLVSIKTDDLLLIGMAIFALSWSANWLTTNLISPKDKREGLVKIIGAAQLLVLVVQAIMMVRMTIAYHAFNAYQYTTLGIEALFLLLWYLAKRQRWVFANRGTTFIKGALLACTTLFAVFAVGRAAYLAYHNAEYQYCPEDNALIIDYTSGVYAIEKGIVSLDDDGSCVLTGGYVLRNVEGKQLRVVRLGHIDVDVERE